MIIGLIVAMEKEFNLMAKILENKNQKKINHLDFVEGTFSDKKIVMMRSGMGKVNAAVATVEMITLFHPDVIINTGIAGCIDKNLSVMDMVAGQKVVYHDVWCGEGEYGQVQGLPLYFNGDSQLLKKIASVKSDIKIHLGTITSGDMFVAKVEELQAIKEKFPDGLAVDMESGAIAQVCYLYKIPYLALRIISDTPGIENHYQQYLDFWNKAPEKSLEIIKALLS